MYRAFERYGGALLADADRRGCRTESDHDRRPEQQCSTEGLGCTRCSAVWLLSAWPDHVGHRAACIEQEPLRCRYRQLHVGQYLPLRYVSTHSRRHQSGSESLRGIDTWISSKINLAAISSRLRQQSAAVWRWASIFRAEAVWRKLQTRALRPMHGSGARPITRSPSWWPGRKWARVLPPPCPCS